MPKGSSATLSYQDKVAATVDAQLKRAEANQLFKGGDIAGAVVAYEAALAEVVLDEDRLPLLSNLGFCHLKLAATEGSSNSKVPSELDAAREGLQAGLALGAACFKAPVLAAKVAGRLLEACRRSGHATGERAAIAECRFYQSVALEKGATPPVIELPEAPAADQVTALLMAIGSAEDDEGVAAVVAALNSAAGEALDDHRMNALCLAVHISALRGGSKVLEAVLATGTPPDARHENGRTALMLAANNGRLDLCTMLLDSGASAMAVDGEGCTALHACCIDLNLAAERAEAGFACNPTAVVALLLSRGCAAMATSNDGATALGHCESHKGGHAAAAACADVLAQWVT